MSAAADAAAATAARAAARAAAPAAAAAAAAAAPLNFLSLNLFCFFQQCILHNQTESA